MIDIDRLKKLTSRKRERSTSQKTRCQIRGDDRLIDLPPKGRIVTGIPTPEVWQRSEDDPVIVGDVISMQKCKMIPKDN